MGQDTWGNCFNIWNCFTLRLGRAWRLCIIFGFVRSIHFCLDAQEDEIRPAQPGARAGRIDRDAGISDRPCTHHCLAKSPQSCARRQFTFSNSTDARWQQWDLGWPHILSNPLTGHGFPLGATIINWNQGVTIDSGYLSLLVETGLLGFITFVAFLILPMWYGGRRYFADRSQAGALSGALACSVLAFSVYRLVLSQRENHMLLYTLIAIVVLLRYLESEGAGRSGETRTGHRQPIRAWPRATPAGAGRSPFPLQPRGIVETIKRPSSLSSWSA